MKILQDACGEIERKKSRFLCYLHRTGSEEEAKEWLKALKKEHAGARHFCTAMRIGNTVRSSDDGEPSGTAGRPMMAVLEGAGLEDVFCVVVRYFGGTLLGTGGLVKAYSDAVKEALDHAILTETRTAELFLVSVPYSLSGRVQPIVSRHTVLEENYGEEISWLTAVKPEDVEAFLSDVAAASRGTVSPISMGSQESEVSP